MLDIHPEISIAPEGQFVMNQGENEPLPIVKTKNMQS